MMEFLSLKELHRLPPLPQGQTQHRRATSPRTPLPRSGFVLWVVGYAAQVSRSRQLQLTLRTFTTKQQQKAVVRRGRELPGDELAIGRTRHPAHAVWHRRDDDGVAEQAEEQDAPRLIVGAGAADDATAVAALLQQLSYATDADDTPERNALIYDYKNLITPDAVRI